jgi:hypothetical protein
VVAFRKQTLLSLDDCLYALQATIPHLTRSSLFRCPGRDRRRQASQASHSSAIPATSLRGRRSNVSFAQLHKSGARQYPRRLPGSSIEAIPYQIYAVLTDMMRARDIGNPTVGTTAVPAH